MGYLVVVSIWRMVFEDVWSMVWILRMRDCVRGVRWFFCRILRMVMVLFVCVLGIMFCFEIVLRCFVK